MSLHSSNSNIGFVSYKGEKKILFKPDFQYKQDSFLHLFK